MGWRRMGTFLRAGEGHGEKHAWFRRGDDEPGHAADGGETTLSVRSWRMMRVRAAPNAVADGHLGASRHSRREQTMRRTRPEMVSEA